MTLSIKKRNFEVTFFPAPLLSLAIWVLESRDSLTEPKPR
jgi:hypothetical protein